MRNVKSLVLKELVKNGYSETNGNKVWNIANRSFLYLTSRLSKSFLKLRNHERYKENELIRENKLIEENVPKLLKELQEKSFNLINVGCGEGKKASVFINSLDKTSKIRFCPLNVDEYLVNLALENVKKEKFSNVKDYVPYVIDSFEILDGAISVLRNEKYQKNVVLLLGSLLASYEVNDFLFNLSQAMFKGDYLVIGNAIRSGERFSGDVSVYLNPLLDEWFMNLLYEIDFKDDDITYNARFANSRVECYYTLNVDKTLDYVGKKIEMKKGDQILVAVLYKFFAEELEKFCKMYFSKVDLIVDEQNEYALVVCKK